MSWKTLFDEEALEAGFNLYLAKAVKNLKLEDLEVYAEVGSSFVEVTFDESGGIVRARVDGKKERPELIAAVMYEVTDPVVQNNYIQDVLDMIASASEDEVRSFLDSLVLDKPAVANEARRWFGDNFAVLEDILDEMRELFRGFGYELTEEALEILSGELTAFMRKYVPSMAASGRYEDISELLVISCGFLSNRSPETEDGIEKALDKLLSEVTDLCLKSGEKARGRTFQMLLEIASIDGFMDYQGTLEDFLVDRFSEPDEIRKLLSYTQEILDKEADPYLRQRYAGVKHTLLTRQGRDDAEIKALMGKDWDEPVITLRRARSLAEKGSADEAVNLLQAAYDRTTDPFGREYVSRELSKLYRELGRKEEEVQELVRYLSSYEFSYELSDRLRDIASEDEWDEAKKTIAGTMIYEDRLDFYQWYGDKEALLEELRSSGRMEDLWEYVKDLLPEYEVEVASLAVSLVQKELEQAESRTSYHHIGAFFRELAELMPSERQRFWEAYGQILEDHRENKALRQELESAFSSLREL